MKKRGSFFNTCEMHVYHVIFLLLCLSLATALYIPAYPKKIFYFIGYLSGAFMLYSIYKGKFITDKTAIIASLALFLIGIIRFTWSYIFCNTIFTDVNSNYHDSGKIFIISSLIIYFIMTWRNHSEPRTLKIGCAFLFIGLSFTLGISLHEQTLTDVRVKLLSDSSGTVSYLMTSLALCGLFIAAKIFHGRCLLMIYIITFIINMILMTLTQSRAGILTVPFLYLIFFFLNFKPKSWLIIVIGIIMLAGSFALLPDSVRERLYNIEKEVSSYHTNNNTSIGARISIWKAGFHSISWHLMGQSSDERTTKARYYIVTQERNNPEAYENIKYHLHNDILETLSLQGLLGGLSVILFYLAFIIIPLFFRNYSLSLLTIAIFTFGLTDTVLIQQSSVLIICMSISIISALLKPSVKSHKELSNY